MKIKLLRDMDDANAIGKKGDELERSPEVARMLVVSKCAEYVTEPAMETATITPAERATVPDGKPRVKGSDR